MPQLLADGLQDPAIEVPVAQDVVEYGEAWEFHMGLDCGCAGEPTYPHLAVRSNKVQRVTEVETLQQWITMALATDRYRWEIYDSQYGTDFKELIAASVPEDEAESAVIRAIRDSLLVDPRIDSITSVNVVDGRSLGNPSAFVVEVRVVTFTGELALLQLDLSDVEMLDAYFNS